MTLSNEIAVLEQDTALLAKEIREEKERAGPPPRVPSLAARNHGFETRREYYAAIVANSPGQGKTLTDLRLRPFYNASVGFALPAEHNAEVLKAVLTPDSIGGRCRLWQAGKSNVSVPVDTNPPWASPIQVTWLGGPTGDTTIATPSKPELERHNYALNRAAVLVPVTNELLEDAPLLESYLDETGPAALRWALDFEIVHGVGVARPLGILNADCLITVSPGSPAVLNYDALTGMLNSFGGDRSQAVWLAHPDTEQTLLNVRDSNGNPVYLFGPGESIGRIFGMPVLPHEVCNASGSKGDLILADFSQYHLVAKTRRRAPSVHIWFDQDLAAFRFVLPTDGAPLLSQPTSSRVGGGQRSPFVCLGVR